MFFQRIQASALYFSSLSGGSVRCSFADRLKAAEPRKSAILPFNKPQQPAVSICVYILGADGCSLCRKAVLSARRIVAALSPPLRLQDSQAALSHSGSPSVLQGRPALQGEFRRSGAGLYRQKGEALGLLSATEGKHLDSSSPFSKSARGSRETDDLQRTRASEVSVEVRELSLDQAPSACHLLGLKGAEVRALREEIPVVFINGQKVCSLRLDGPAIRVALLKELRRLGVEPIESRS